MSVSSTPPLLPLNNNIINNSEEETHDPSSSSSSSSPFQNLKPSILVIVLIVSITFLLSISLCLLLRHLNRRCLRHLSSSSSSSNPTTTTTTTTTTTSTIRVSPQTPPSLISIIDSLPLFTFSSIKRRSTNSSGDCAVCLSKFEPQDQLRLLPLCCHAFHVHCIDTWLHSNQTCPLCRSPIHPSESDLLLKSRVSTTDDDDGLGAESFRLEIGSISRRQTSDQSRTSYSVGSFEYVVEEDSEVTTSMHRRSVSDKEIGGGQDQADQECNNLASAAGGGGRSSWLKDYVDRLSTSLSLSISSRALSFRSSGRFFTGSSRRSEIPSLGDYDVEANRVGEEISEMFRWFSGV